MLSAQIQYNASKSMNTITLTVAVTQMLRYFHGGRGGAILIGSQRAQVKCISSCSPNVQNVFLSFTSRPEIDILIVICDEHLRRTMMLTSVTMMLIGSYSEWFLPGKPFPIPEQGDPWTRHRLLRIQIAPWTGGAPSQIPLSCFPHHHDRSSSPSKLASLCNTVINLLCHPMS